ncbi:hypothetical protein FEM48_Zijuj07G0103700 [Ziziphus jujuba var. spinosa]|uniref:Splicing factor 3B subunit 1 domain-containing protein n=1 Tax=Ziziphus jujuba var. spinosa TaxID=714518 RepID=A0A978V433_ZIZJJ|nr:hypothetical protein FEM48_Zijuj07G0103700 [Ziziphus jujuba var. spinosa]
MDTDVNENLVRKMASYTAPKLLLKEVPKSSGEDEDVGGSCKQRKQRIIDGGKDEYLRLRLQQHAFSPERNDPFADVMEEETALKRQKRWWDQSQEDDGGPAKKKKAETCDWDLPDATPSSTLARRRSRWDETPTPKRQRSSRWDETPATIMGSSTPMAAAAAAAYTPEVTTPLGGSGFATPVPMAINLPGHYNLVMSWEKDIEDRNRPLTDQELDAMLPPQDKGYKILDPPDSYVPVRTPARKLLATPTSMATPLYYIPKENRGQHFDVPKEPPAGLPTMKPEDY